MRNGQVIASARVSECFVWSSGAWNEPMNNNTSIAHQLSNDNNYNYSYSNSTSSGGGKRKSRGKMIFNP